MTDIRRISLICIGSLLGFATCAADLPETTITIRDHLFFPQTVVIPANQKVKITFINEDPTPEEIDSFDLNREKVIFGRSTGSIFVGPLPPGEYQFFGEFHPNSAIGMVRVQGQEQSHVN